MKKSNRIMRWIFLLLLPFCAGAQAQESSNGTRIKPVIDYAGTAQKCYIGGIAIDGAESNDDYVLIGISGLSVGQLISVPGDEITRAIKRYWKNQLFSNVRIEADSIVGDQIYLHIYLTERPKVSQINYSGVKKSEREDLEAKLGLLKGNQITPNMIDRAKLLASKYFDEKGFKNAEINVMQRTDPDKKDMVIVNIDIDKHEKVKIRHITIEGNECIPTNKIKGGIFSKSLLGKTYEKDRAFANFFKNKKYIPANFEEGKKTLIEKYNEYGYKDAYVVVDSVYPAANPSEVNIYLKVEEGQKYYLRNVEWVGNTVFPTSQLEYLLRMKKGDVYNQKHLNQRISEDEDAISNLYYNNGYVFNHIDPVEVNIENDSVDLEIRVIEGKQATINHVRIFGNDRVYENVVRRELKNKPGDLFNRDALTRSYREIASMGHFEPTPEALKADVQPDQENGTVDINWGLTSKSNDQVEFSLGWGQTGVIGKLGLKFSNFSIKNLFTKGGIHRGILPQGDGQTLSLSGQTNGTYYQAYNISFLDPWFGGKRPNSLSVSASFSKSTDVSSRYYNSSYYNSYYNYLYGYGSSGSSYYENYYDPDKYIMMYSLGIGWGKRLRWPDDWFTLSASLQFERYMLKNWSYFMITNGNCNNINLTLSLNRNSTDNQFFPRKGSDFTFSVTLTPPFSLWDGKDYKNLATNSSSSTYQKELQEKYKWVEYHKWKFKIRTYTSLASITKCPVLMTRVEFGILGSYNKYKKSPFETYYMGGDGMSGYTYGYATETIGLRGYDNGSLTPYGYEGYAYTRIGAELRFPLMLESSTSIYCLAFVEGGNAWTEAKNLNPFDLKRSAGVGVRIYLPMVGLMGIDWGYGFDKVFGSKSYGGSRFHFVLGQEF